MLLSSPVRLARRSLRPTVSGLGLVLSVAATLAGFALEQSSASAATAVSYGAVTLGTARYTVPSGAYYVSPRGSDSASGSLSSPWRTVQHAVSTAKSGSTIVLRASTYRESVTFYGKALTLENYPGEKVWLSGSDQVTGWTNDGSAYRKDNWTAHFAQGGRSDLTDSRYPLSSYPDQVFVDGVSQTQVASRSAVTAGTFYVNYATKQLFMGTNPSGHQVEASTRSRALYLNKADNSIVRGIGFDHYANHPSDLGAVLADGNNVLIENCVISQNASIGVTVLGTNTKIVRDTISDNGQLGLHADTANGLVVQHDLLQHNDTEHFAVTGAEGNLKVTSTDGVTVQDTMSRYSLGRGMWFDIHSSNVTAVRNVIANNADRGMQFELSIGAILASNIYTSNGSDGLSVVASQNVQVYNDSFWHNARSVYVINDARQNVQNVTIRNSVVSASRPGTSQILAVEDVTRSRTASQMNVTANSDAYAQVGSFAASWWFGWAAYPSSYPVYRSLDAYKSATGMESSSAGVSSASASDPFFNDPANGDFGLRSGSAAAGVRGTSLPTSVASALGVTAGMTPPVGSLTTSAIAG